MKTSNRLNVLLTALALSVTLALTTVSSYATGIPTLDAATGLILENNAIQTAKQAADALKQAKDGIDQARQQYENYKSIITGNDKLGDFLNNPALNKVLPMGDWADLYSSVQDIASLRDRYGLKSDNSSVQQQFDKILAGADALERMYDAGTQRVNNAQQLRAQLNQVETPQQKADLQLRYQQELLEQQNQQAQLATLQMLEQKQEKIENTKRGQAFSDYMRGKSKVLPSYE
jgi:type IV secretion system protein VirB5